MSNLGGPKKSNKVFDVAKPGETAPPSTAKPVIVGHKSMLKDPMMKDEGVVTLTADTDQEQKVEQEPDDKPSGTPPTAREAGPTTAPTLSRIKIQPLGNQAAEDKPKKRTKLQIKSSDESENNGTGKATDSITDEPAQAKVPATKGQTTNNDDAEETASEENPEPVDSDSEQDTETQTSSSTTNTAAEINAVTNQTIAQKKATKEAEENAAKQAALEKVIESKKYYVPIGEKTRKKRSMRNILLGLLLIIVLGALLFDALLDAGFVHYKNLTPPIRIINR